MAVLRSAKRLVNACLNPLNLRIGKARDSRISGVHLFSDIHKLLKSDDPTCLDIGANEGQTIAELVREFQSPTIWAFEPASEPYESLRSQSYGDKVSVVKRAMGDQSGSVVLKKFTKSVFNSLLALSEDSENPVVDQAIVGSEEVPVTTVDIFCREKAIDSLDLLKIDTQGFELMVLKGANQMLSDGKIAVVSLEINFAPLYDGQPTRDEIEGFLRERGYGLIGYYEIARKNGCIAWCTALFSLRGEGSHMEYN